MLSPPPQRWRQGDVGIPSAASPPAPASPAQPHFSADVGNFSTLDDAGRKLGSCMKDDEEVKDLYNVLQEPDHQSFQLRGWPPLMKKAGNLVELPQLVRDRYNSCQSGICFCGVFPSIRRAWATVDNSLFLWRFDKRDDIPVEYSGEEQAICAVGLAKPRAGVFIAAIQHLLILATPVEIVLLGVCCSKGKVNGDEFEDLTLQPLPLYTIPSDNVVMSTIVSTKSGRIFLGGGDGHLYELNYSSGEGWRQKRCSKVCYSGGVSWLLPSFLRLRPPSPIAQIAVDEDRMILYTRSQSSAISVYDLGAAGDQPLVRAAELSDVAGAMNRVARGRDFLSRGAVDAPGGGRAKKGSAIVHIAPISRAESSRLQLLAVAADGRRAYFSAIGDTQLRFERAPRPTKLECKRVCAPPQPPQQPSSSYLLGGAALVGPVGSALQLAEVECAYYRDGVLLVSEASAGGSDSTLLLVAPDMMAPPSGGEAYGMGGGGSHLRGGLRETVADLRLVGQACALGELDPEGGVAAGADMTGRHELATQHLVPPRRFVAVTTAGLQVVAKCRPVDVLQELLEDGGAEDPRLYDFFKSYGQKEAAAMCLLLATSPAGPAGAGAGSRVVDAARRAFADVRLTGEPRMEDGTAMGGYGGGGWGSPAGGMAAYPASRTPNGFDMGHAVLAPLAVFSGAHEGLCLYASRVLQQVWERTLSTGTPDAMLSLRMPGDLMQALEERLRSLAAFVAEVGSRRRRAGYGEAAGGAGGAGPGGFLGAGASVAGVVPLAPTGQRYQRREALTKRRKVEDAALQEGRSMAAIGAVLQRAAQALYLLRFLREHHFGRLVLRLDPPARAEVAALTFRKLATSPEGEKLASLLITALMSMHMESGAGQQGGVPSWVDELATPLQAGCPLFFKEDDRTFYRAREQLAQAHLLGADSGERGAAASKALALLLQVPLAVNLPAVVPELEELQCFEGVVQLPLRCAAAHAAAAEAAGEGTAAHAAAMGARDACYRAVTGVVESLIRGRPAHVVMSPGGAEPPSGRKAKAPSEADRKRWLQQVLALAAKSPDRAFQEHLYAALLRLQQGSELLQIKAPFLEEYLRRRAGWPGPSAALSPEAVQHAELLAKLYTERSNFAGAAQVLTWLGERRGLPGPSPSPTLEERQAYLRSAVLQAKSQGPGGAVGGGGVPQLLDRAEAQLDRAEAQLRVLGFQRRILEALRGRRGAGAESAAAGAAAGAAGQPAVGELASDLKTLTELYNDFAHPCKLYDVCVEMADFAGNVDGDIIAGLWDRHLDQGVSEALAAGGGAAGALSEVCERARRLGEALYPSEASFPRAHVALRLEEVAAGLWPAAMQPAAAVAARPDPSAVPTALLAACKQSHELIRQTYDELLSRKGGELQDPRLRLQLLRSLLHVVDASAGALQPAPLGGGGYLRGGGGAHGRLRELCDWCIQEVRRLQVDPAAAQELIRDFEVVRKKISPAV